MREIAFLAAMLLMTIYMSMRLIDFTDKVERLHYSGKPDKRRRIVMEFIRLSMDVTVFALIIFVIHRFK